ncbi:hypothetical protein CROQUDRAFT_219454 [Cronartium quercuum f. sp. fusiforme G11]|uniref:Rab-GAP TBC domain-containing protein n=1 Tax=Cronartium quercuum f. sp. fusiforme G11 TaxID=708437 RepID=A0A9P6NEI9_9BASI|nr:hypothetical protein CROQUDRAFT_219454 [Cronartium quercuum f. sp. fusiforme G11]
MGYFINQLQQSNQINKTLQIIETDVKRTQANLRFFKINQTIELDSPAAFKLKILISHLNQIHQNSSKQIGQDVIEEEDNTKRNSIASTSSYTTTTSITHSNLDSDDETIYKRQHKLQPIIIEELHQSIMTPQLNFQAPSPISPTQEESSLIYNYHHCLTRLLFIWASLNPGVGYIQGMNEIGAILIYVFGQQKDNLSFEEIEADSFWAFTNLMISIRDIYITELDLIPISNQNLNLIGINKLLNQYENQLIQIDLNLFNHLKCLGLSDSRLYAFNWFSSLFTHSFDLFNVIKIWDTLISIQNDLEKLDFLVDLACSYTILLSNELFRMLSFDKAIILLQSKNQLKSINQLIQNALLIRNQRIKNLHEDKGWIGDEGKGVGWEEYDETTSPSIWSSTIQRLTPTTNTINQENNSFFGKLKDKAEAWKDSDTAASLSKQATNWTIMASSWRPTPTIVSKLTSLSLSNNNLKNQPPSQEEENHGWSTNSNEALTPSSSSSNLESPLNTTGPKPLLLSSRARTSLKGSPIQPNSSSIISELGKRLSSPKPQPTPKVHRSSLADPFHSPTTATTVNILGRDRSSMPSPSPSTHLRHSLPHPPA